MMLYCEDGRVDDGSSPDSSAFYRAAIEIYNLGPIEEEEKSSEVLSSASASGFACWIHHAEMLS